MTIQTWRWQRSEFYGNYLQKAKNKNKPIGMQRMALLLQGKVNKSWTNVYVTVLSNLDNLSDLNVILK